MTHLATLRTPSSSAKHSKHIHMPSIAKSNQRPTHTVRIMCIELAEQAVLARKAAWQHLHTVEGFRVCFCEWLRAAPQLTLIRKMRYMRYISYIYCHRLPLRTLVIRDQGLLCRYKNQSFCCHLPCLLPIRLCGLLDLGQGCPCPAWHH